MDSLQKELEKKYFKLSFSKIKNNPALKHLKLKDEEIIENRTLIKEALNSIELCGDSQKFCNNLNTHYSLRRNSDGKIILSKIDCLKTKNYEKISEIEINKKLKKGITNQSYLFDNSRAKESINILSKCNSSLINELIENLGNPNYKIPNTFFVTNSINKEAIILFTYHMILINEPVIVIKSSELKEICTNTKFQFNKEDQESSLNGWRKICDCKNLIIENLGLENIVSKQNYYLDFIPEILSLRNSKQKSTYIITPISLEVIFREIKESIGKDFSEIKKHKLDELEHIMKILFTGKA